MALVLISNNIIGDNDNELHLKLFVISWICRRIYVIHIPVQNNFYFPLEYKEQREW